MTVFAAMLAWGCVLGSIIAGVLMFAHKDSPAAIGFCLIGGVLVAVMGRVAVQSRCPQ